jgi:hypothetical protein
MLSILDAQRISKKFFLMFVFSTVALAQSPIAEIPNATLIGPEGITITAISIPNAVLQFGIGTTWCTVITGPKLPLLVSYVSPNLALCPFDPKPNVAKSIVAQQQTSTYTVTYTLNGGTVTKTIPALIPPPTTWSFNCPATVTGTVSSTGVLALGTVTLTGTCQGVKQ